MTDEEFLEADIDALLQSMTPEEIEARRDSLIKSLLANVDDDDEALYVWLEGVIHAPATGRRRCIACDCWLPPQTRRCTECGEPLPIIGENRCEVA